MLRYSSKLLTPFLHSFKRNLRLTPKYSFSTSKFNSASPLIRSINQQIHQQQIKNIGSEAIINSIKKHKWSIVNQGTLVEMTKQHSPNTTVRVVFYVEPPHPEESVTTVQQNVMKSTNISDYQQFSVYIQKQGLQKIMCADFFLNEDELRIVSLAFTKDYNQHRQTPGYNRNKNVYQGPDLLTLQSNLNKKIHQYFEQMGINSQVTSFIRQYSINQQHIFYRNWLNSLRTFVREQ